MNDITDEYSVLGLFGPKSRDLISNISKDNFSNSEFKFSTGKYINIDGIKVWAQRLSYVGELGYELYILNSNSEKIFFELLTSLLYILITLLNKISPNLNISSK